MTYSYNLDVNEEALQERHRKYIAANVETDIAGADRVPSLSETEPCSARSASRRASVAPTSGSSRVGGYLTAT
jgi:hypothetical protein